MKLLIECLLAVFLHPIAVVFVWMNIAARSDMSGGKKALWAVVSLFWGVGPILYVMLGDGTFW